MNLLTIGEWDWESGNEESCNGGRDGGREGGSGGGREGGSGRGWPKLNAEVILRDLHDSPYYTKAEFIQYLFDHSFKI